MTSIRTIYDFIDAIQTDSEARRRIVAALNMADTDTQERVLASVDRLTHNVESLTITVVEQSRNIAEQSRNIAEQGRNIESLTHTVGEHSRSIDSLTITMAEQGRRIDSLTQTVGDQAKNIDSLIQNVDSLTHTVAEQGRHIGSLIQNVETLTHTVAEQGRHIGSLIQNVETLTHTVGEQGRHIDSLIQNVETLTITMTEQGRRIDSLTQTVGDLSARVLGNDTEDRAVDKIIADLGVLFRGVRGTRLMYAHHGRLGFNDDYGQIIQAARDNNEIEPTEFRRLVSTDIVFSARRGGKAHIFPAEVSNTLSKRDVDQAVRSSHLISEVFRNKVGPVTGTEYGDLAVQPIVAGATVPDLVQDHADSLDVEVVTVNVPTMHSETER